MRVFFFMQEMKVHSLYFSATGTTAKVVGAIASAAAKTLAADVACHDVTPVTSRKGSLEFTGSDLVIFGVPVYIGRVPNLIKPWLETIKGGGAFGVPVVVYGNRAYDDALLELYDMMTACGFICTAAAAFVGEHSFSRTLGAGRPDAADLQAAASFGERVAHLREPLASSLPGRRPAQFYKALDDEGKPFDIRKAKPETDLSLCNGCGICVAVCPMGSISISEPSSVEGICIKCGACVKKCPSGAKRFTDPEYFRHLSILERDYTSGRKTPEFFL